MAKEGSPQHLACGFFALKVSEVLIFLLFQKSRHLIFTDFPEISSVAKLVQKLCHILMG